jgi:phage antirepressor YoqD-like protein
MYNQEVSSDMIQADLNEFILEIATQYKENRATKYPFLDQISSDLYSIKNTFSKAGDAAFTEKGVEK